MDWPRDNETEKIHPTQKPVALLERLIEIFTDPGDVVIDPVAGSGTSLIAADNLGRKSFGFEFKKNFYKDAIILMDKYKTRREEIQTIGYSKTEIGKYHPTLFENEK